jgi:SAM-dependent methyltransferase
MKRLLNFYASALVLLFNFGTSDGLVRDVKLPRRAIFAAGGASVYGVLVGSTLKRIQKAKSDSPYTNAIMEVIHRTVDTGSGNSGSEKAEGEPLRVLEVGIGPEADHLERYPPGIAFTGLDPEGWTARQASLVQGRAEARGFASVELVQESIQEHLARVGTAKYDAVLGFFVLCSVIDVDEALQGISGLLKPGRPYGFVEHVRAPDGSSMLRQQELLSPLQQLVAHNCHLERPTDETLVAAATASGSSPTALFSRVEVLGRYEVPSMWPVSEQAWGVLLR